MRLLMDKRVDIRMNYKVGKKGVMVYFHHHI
jgi:hypothetical protein